MVGERCDFSHSPGRFSLLRPRQPIESVPWQFAILSEVGSFNCAGTILNDMWIVTAIHCEILEGDTVGAGASKLDVLRAAGSGAANAINPESAQIRTVLSAVAPNAP